jgi:hypothetical protein
MIEILGLNALMPAMRAAFNMGELMRPRLRWGSAILLCNMVQGSAEWRFEERSDNFVGQERLEYLSDR